MQKRFSRKGENETGERSQGIDPIYCTPPSSQPIWGSIQKEVISDLKGVRQFLKEEIWESITVDWSAERDE